MNRIAKSLLCTAVALLLSLPGRVSAQTCEGSANDLFRKVMATIEGLKPGTQRTKLDLDFVHDGGLTFSGERFVYRACTIIKIDVTFTYKNGHAWPQASPEDTLSTISKPYLENPMND